MAALYTSIRNSEDGLNLGMQDPVLFSGTLRSNMDPKGKADDARLWEVLRAVQLGPAVERLGGLDARMAEAGDNLSVGQRQLCAPSFGYISHGSGALFEICLVLLAYEACLTAQIWTELGSEHHQYRVSTAERSAACKIFGTGQLPWCSLFGPHVSGRLALTDPTTSYSWFPEIAAYAALGDRNCNAGG